MDAIYTVARKETIEHFRTKRMYIIGGLFALSFMAAAIVGPLLLNQTRDVLPEDIGTILYFYLTAFGGYLFISLLAIVFTADTIVGEWKDRSLFLLLSKPIARWHVLTGKVVGAYLSVLLVTVPVFLVGVGVLIGFLGWPEGDLIGRVFLALAILVLGLLPFIGLGTLCSVLFRSPITSFIVAIGMRFVGFGLISTIGIFVFIARGGFSDDLSSNPIFVFFLYFNPSNLVQIASTVLLPEASGADFFSIQGEAGDIVPGALFAMGLHTLVYLGISYVVLARRDYA